MRDRLISSRFFDLVDVANASPRLRLSRRGRWMHALTLEGDFPPGWCGRLSLGLSHAGINIVRGFARRLSRGGWVAELELLAQDGGADPAQLDHLALAKAPALPGPPLPITLDSYYIDASPESGAHLFLEVRAPDRVGFLGSLLERLADVGLVPEQMSIETWQGRALDCFYLRREPPDGRFPVGDLFSELSSMLDTLRAPASPAPSPAPAAAPTG